MISCKHDPEVQVGVKCDCLDCRTARAVALNAIAGQCHQCCGEMATDARGEVTCAKQAVLACPVLDLWYCVVYREIDPTKVTPVLAELVFQGIKEPPRRFGNADKPDHFAHAMAYATMEATCTSKTISIAPGEHDGLPPDTLRLASDRLVASGKPRVLVVADNRSVCASIMSIINNLCKGGVKTDFSLLDENDPSEVLTQAHGYDIAYIAAMLDDGDDATNGLEEAVMTAVEAGLILVAPSTHPKLLYLPARLPGVIPVVATRKRPESLTEPFERFTVADVGELPIVHAVAAFVVSQLAKNRDIAALPSAVVWETGKVFTVGHQGA